MKTDQKSILIHLLLFFIVDAIYGRVLIPQFQYISCYSLSLIFPIFSLLIFFIISQNTRVCNISPRQYRLFVFIYKRILNLIFSTLSTFSFKIRLVIFMLLLIDFPAFFILSCRETFFLQNQLFFIILFSISKYFFSNTLSFIHFIISPCFSFPSNSSIRLINSKSVISYYSLILFL